MEVEQATYRKDEVPNVCHRGTVNHLEFPQRLLAGMRYQQSARRRPQVALPPIYGNASEHSPKRWHLFETKEETLPGRSKASDIC